VIFVVLWRNSQGDLPKSSLQAMACREYSSPKAYLVWATMETASHNRWRSISASICLLAVLFIYTPLATAAWTAHCSACCASGQCPIKEHHHHQAASADSNHMDCGHNMSGMMACRMSCCHNPEAPAVASAIFVLPLPFVPSAPASFKSGIVLLRSQDSSRSIKPLSPPPRFLSAVA
jgi:hypothetical protein